MADSASYLIHSDRGTALAADVPEVREHSPTCNHFVVIDRGGQTDSCCSSRKSTAFTTNTTGAAPSSTFSSKCLKKARGSHGFKRGDDVVHRLYSPKGTKRRAADRRSEQSGGGLANSCRCHFSCQKGISSLLMSAFSFSGPSARLAQQRARSLPPSHQRERPRPSRPAPTRRQTGNRGGWVRQAAARRSRVTARQAAAKAGAAGASAAGGRGLCAEDIWSG